MSEEICIINADGKIIFGTRFELTKEKTLIQIPWIRHSKPHTFRVGNMSTCFEEKINKKNYKILVAMIKENHFMIRGHLAYGTDDTRPSYAGYIKIEKKEVTNENK